MKNQEIFKEVMVKKFPKLMKESGSRFKKLNQPQNKHKATSGNCRQTSENQVKINS